MLAWGLGLEARYCVGAFLSILTLVFSWHVGDLIGVEDGGVDN